MGRVLGGERCSLSFSKNNKAETRRWNVQDYKAKLTEENPDNKLQYTCSRVSADPLAAAALTLDQFRAYLTLVYAHQGHQGPQGLSGYSDRTWSDQGQICRSYCESFCPIQSFLTGLDVLRPCLCRSSACSRRKSQLDG